MFYCISSYVLYSNIFLFYDIHYHIERDFESFIVFSFSIFLFVLNIIYFIKTRFWTANDSEYNTIESIKKQIEKKELGRTLCGWED